MRHVMTGCLAIGLTAFGAAIVYATNQFVPEVDQVVHQLQDLNQHMQTIEQYGTLIQQGGN